MTQTDIALREHQIPAVEEIVQAFEDGVKVVILDAPTGSGKTFIAEEVRRRLDVRGLYVCTTKGLQDQFCADFPEAKVLKGRANYPTQWGGEVVDASDCTDTTGQHCAWCDKGGCPYTLAKRSALGADIAVLNTSYFLLEANYAGGFSKRQFVVLDEADELEGSLMGFCGFHAGGEWPLKKMGLTPPIKGARKGTIAAWLTDSYIPAMNRKGDRLKGDKDPKALKERRGIMAKAVEAAWIAEQLRSEDEDVTGAWVRDNDAGPLVMKTATVSHYGMSRLWRHSSRWLLMTGSVVSAEELVESLGIDVEHQVVKVPMTFDVDARRIVVLGLANVTRGDYDAALPALVRGIERIAERHPDDERILVHTVSYQLARDLAERLMVQREVFTYADSRGRGEVVGRYTRSKGGILLAPSMDRGFDFKDDLARVVVIAKVPFPNLGDRMVSTRMHMPGGDLWYRVQTVRTILQMTGRGVRNVDDWCTTYILDRQFQSNVMKNSKGLFPKWWRDALDQTVSVKEFL